MVSLFKYKVFAYVLLLVYDQPQLVMHVPKIKNENGTAENFFPIPGVLLICLSNAEFNHKIYEQTHSSTRNYQAY